MRLLDELGTALSGGGRDRLTALAGDLGLLAWAERRCASRRWSRRLRGVRLLTLVGGGEACVPILLSDANREVRAAAATWSANRPDPQSVGCLLDLLGDGEPLVRFMAKNALLKIGRASVEPLARRLSQVSGRELEGALEVAIGLAEPRLAAPALPLASADAARVRSLTATLTAAVGGPHAVATVEGLLDDPAPEVRAAAVGALGKLGHWPSGPAIAIALRDPAWEVRRQAALALRALGAPGLVLLRRSLMDEDRYARDMARQVLDLPGAVSKSPRRRLEMPA
jgi:HEAT repeat protein